MAETRPLDRATADLDRDDLLFLSVSKYQAYATAEIAACAAFVARGGKMLVCGEHDDVYRVSSGLQNPMLAPFGLRFAHDCLAVAGNDWIEVSSRELGVLGAVFYASPTLHAEGPGTRILSDGLPVIGQFDHRSGGRVVAVADSEFTLNGEYPRGRAARFGIRHGFNRAMAHALVRRALALEGRPPARDSAAGAFAYPATGEVHVFTGRNGGIPDAEADGFSRLLAGLSERGLRLTRADDFAAIPSGAAALLLHPLEGPELAGRDRLGRVAVIGDAWSEIDPYTDNGMLLGEAGIGDPPPPFFARFLSARGIAFPAGYLMDLDRFREEQTAVSAWPPHADTPEVALKRSGLLLAGPRVEPWLLPAPTTFWNPVCLGLDERVPWRPDMERDFYRREDERPENTGRAKWEANLRIPTRPASDVPAGPRAALARCGETLALADADAVSNRFLEEFPGNAALADAIAEFFRR